LEVDLPGDLDLALAGRFFLTSQLATIGLGATFCLACAGLPKKHKTKKQAATVRHLLPNDFMNPKLCS
jgi:hypothetical protein